MLRPNDLDPVFPFGLRPRTALEAQVQALGPDTWRLHLPAGPAGRYRLAQLDDYCGQPRRAFLRQPPLRLELSARSSAAVLPGTWGFGLWNDPFGLGLLYGGELLHLPALPQAAWFFFASPPNHLTLRDSLPGQGALAAVFRSRRWPMILLAPGAPLLPLLGWPPFGRLARRLARGLIDEAGIELALDVCDWHRYSLEWQTDGVHFSVDGRPVLHSALAPRSPLGLVIWLDNQYAAAPPSGRFSYGALSSEQPAWVEISGLKLVETALDKPPTCE